MYSTELAILGGPKAFKKAFEEKWQRPKDKEKKLINTLIDRDELSGSGFGISLDFEQAFASYIGCQYCLSFSHGTAALMAAYFAAGIGPGDEVLTPAVGYIASYSGAIHMGARPIFCDIDPSSLLINPQEIQKKISLRTKAINITDLNGRICDLDKILSLANHKGIPVVEDASHAHGGYWNKKRSVIFRMQLASVCKVSIQWVKLLLEAKGVLCVQMIKTFTKLCWHTANCIEKISSKNYTIALLKY
ncbi:L-glutamine:2-deoxy-scyllo-inosose aminotransferase [Candidatus Protochlamydia amoebophila]|uniref:L-glutamine:2-deoxy-scyllo-inosose aminotransferase n=1 Tax=Candidatus Protochlamydia amoebophila TaxID=362787 RepID=A0A0C1JP91_9BACT|nr:L-glutamine:2-deoxy-scyllo-inosose aminotransferase [Candidatus Protochlamydia amoebophila]